MSAARIRTRQANEKAAYEAKNIWEDCGKCMGAGSVSWGNNTTGAVYAADGTKREIPQVCFKCNGTGGKYVSQQQLDRRVTSRARREARKAKEMEAKAAAHQERVANARRRWDAVPGNTELAQQLPTLGDFGASLADALATWGCLTDRQAEAARTALANRAAEPAAAPVVEGRGVVVGKVLSTKVHESAYGASLKMTVLDDRGFKLWGSVPAALDKDDAELNLAGRRVQFTAQLQASDKDATFGFFKRPTKAHLI